MSNQISSPIPYPSVNAILAKLLTCVQIILNHGFVGLYVHGSLAYGDFNQQTSDIDFLIVTDGALSAKTFNALKEFHARLFASGQDWSQKLEGAYLPQLDLHCHGSTNAPVPWLGVDGHFALETLGSDWIIQRWILREKGLVIAGPLLRNLIDPVSANDLREAVRMSLSEWWSPPFPSPERFESDEYQAYAVLTMCRSLYLLEHGRVASKPKAALWAIQTLGTPWTGLVSEALAWRQGLIPDKLEETLEFIQFTLHRAGIESVNEAEKIIHWIKHGPD